jgi:hypothetical protein
MTEATTISKLALEIFLKDHYDPSKGGIPLITNKTIYSDLREAYYGGVTEVYKPYGECLNYYDVNSLYPFVAKNPMPGTNCWYREYVSPNPDIERLFGFFSC